jgi:small subunit ribosomal protein S2
MCRRPAQNHIYRVTLGKFKKSSGKKEGHMNIDFSSLPDKAPEIDLRDLLEAGCHFGHQARKWHPKMDEYIYMEKDGIHIFDLAKTAEQLTKAYNFAFKLGSEGKSLVIVGTKRQARELVKAAAKESGAMYIVSRWLGGMLTNWNQISKSLKRMIKLETGLKEGSFAEYTKYERVQFEKEMGRLQRFFDGIRGLKESPDALFIIDPVREANVVKEAQTKNVPTIALVDTNGDPREVDIPIPANDDAMGSIKLIVDMVAAGYKAGKAAK